MDKTCGNCHYIDMSHDNPPCDICINYNQWAEKRDCGNCAYGHQDETQRPCDICEEHNQWTEPAVPVPGLLKGIEDGGKRLTYESGALREPSTGKGRYDLISPFAIERVINWDPAEDDPEQFDDPLDYAYWHINRFRMGDRGPDHLAAASKYIMDVIHEVYAVTYEEKTTWWFNFKISPFALEKIAKWYEKGSEKYADRNWEKGMSYTRLVDSGQRHLNRYREGQRGEDHLSAAVWNLFAYMHYECCHMDKYDDTPRYLEAWAFGEDRIKPEEYQKMIDEAIEKVFGYMKVPRSFVTDLPKPDETVHKLKKRTYKIIAVDFDGCLCTKKWPEIGESNWDAFDELRKRQEQGDKLILWTCRSGLQLQQAIDWCRNREGGIEFDAVNDNLPEINAEFGGFNSRKIFADEYWDDKARNVVAK